MKAETLLLAAVFPVLATQQQMGRSMTYHFYGATEPVLAEEYLVPEPSQCLTIYLCNGEATPPGASGETHDCRNSETIIDGNGNTIRRTCHETPQQYPTPPSAPQDPLSGKDFGGATCDPGKLSHL
jgi:hypothetical protein